MKLRLVEAKKVKGSKIGEIAITKAFYEVDTATCHHKGINYIISASWRFAYHIIYIAILYSLFPSLAPPSHSHEIINIKL